MKAEEYAKRLFQHAATEDETADIIARAQAEARADRDREWREAFEKSGIDPDPLRALLEGK